MIVGGVIIFLVGTLLTNPSEATFFAIPISILSVALLLVWRSGVVGQIAGMLAAAAASFAMFWAVFGLAYPASFVDFVPGDLVPFGAIAAIGGGAAALVQRRKQHLEAAATAAERRMLLVLGAGAALTLPTDSAGTHVLYCKPHANLADPDPQTAGMATSLTIAVR